MDQQNGGFFFEVQRVIEALPDPIYIKHRDGRLAHCNSLFAKIAGVDTEKIIGSFVADISCSEFATSCEKTDKFLLSSNIMTKIYCSSMQNKSNNEQYDVQLIKSVYFGDTGKPNGFVAIVRSLTKKIISSNSKGLTPREVEVISLVACGKTQKMIAYDLGISSHTTAHHMKSIFLKLNATNRVTAVSRARSLGYLSLP